MITKKIGYIWKEQPELVKLTNLNKEARNMEEKSRIYKSFKESNTVNFTEAWSLSIVSKITDL